MVKKIIVIIDYFNYIMLIGNIGLSTWFSLHQDFERANLFLGWAIFTQLIIMQSRKK